MRRLTGLLAVAAVAAGCGAGTHATATRPTSVADTVGRSPTPTAAPTPPGPAQPRLPIRAAFYYGWFPAAWRQQGLDPFTHYRPLAGRYSSVDERTVSRQLRELAYGHVEAALASWWGRGATTDASLPTLLRAVDRSSAVRVAIYYEPEGQGDPTAAALHADLAYVVRRYAGDPAYLRVRGRPVVFAYSDPADGCAMASRWARARRGLRLYVSLKVFPGHRACPDQPDSWHQYAPDRGRFDERGHAFTVSPGFDKATEAAPRLPRSVARFRADVRAMVASREPWQLVTTFNEWGEGTSVEPAAEWRSRSGFGAYLDVLHAIR